MTDEMRYYTADNPRTGVPYAAFRTGPGQPIAVYDPDTDDWVPAGWPVKFLAGSDPNYSDLDPANLDATLARLRAPIETIAATDDLPAGGAADRGD